MPCTTITSRRARCHRIVRLGGELGGYAGGSMRAKVRRLRDEGVAVRRATIDLERFGFRDFVTDRPLEQLREIQTAIQRRIIVRPRRRMPKLVGGVDVAYPQPELGVAAYALVETATGQLVWSTTVRRRVAFPYMSTYLSFREIPILLDLLDEVRRRAGWPRCCWSTAAASCTTRQAGIASHLGVVASVATVGVTKKLLCGQVDIKEMRPGESRPVVERGAADRRGAAADGRQSAADLYFARPSGGRGLLRAAGAAAVDGPAPARADLLGRPPEPPRIVGRIS